MNITEDIKQLELEILKNGEQKQLLLNSISVFQNEIEMAEKEIIEIDLSNEHLINQLNKLNQAKAYILDETIDLVNDENELLKEKEEEIQKEEVFQSMLSNQLSIDFSLLGVFKKFIKDWEMDKKYVKDELVKYQDKVYKVKKSHTSKQGDEPNGNSTLFILFEEDEVNIFDKIPTIFIKPRSLDKGYNKGDRVIFKFKVYESLINQNIESPEEKPENWLKV